MTVTKAIISGNIDLLTYFHTKFDISINHLSPSDLNFAIDRLKSEAMFRYLLTNCRLASFNIETTYIVARSGNLNNLRLLLSKRIPQANSDTLYEAVRSGKSNFVRFLVEEYKIDDKLMITDYREALELAEAKKLGEIANYLKSRMQQSPPEVVVVHQLPPVTPPAATPNTDPVCESGISNEEKLSTTSRV